MEHSAYSDKFVEENKLVESDSDDDIFDDITIDNMLLVRFFFFLTVQTRIKYLNQGFLNFFS